MLTKRVLKILQLTSRFFEDLFFNKLFLDCIVAAKCKAQWIARDVIMYENSVMHVYKLKHEDAQISTNIYLYI